MRPSIVEMRLLFRGPFKTGGIEKMRMPKRSSPSSMSWSSVNTRMMLGFFSRGRTLDLGGRGSFFRGGTGEDGRATGTPLHTGRRPSKAEELDVAADAGPASPRDSDHGPETRASLGSGFVERRQEVGGSRSSRRHETFPIVCKFVHRFGIVGLLWTEDGTKLLAKVDL